MSTFVQRISGAGALPIEMTREGGKPVGYFISYIRERVGSATRNWREIAQAFADAKEMYGADSVTFKELCTQTKFTRSTADRLAKIATDNRLKKHTEDLAAVHSWSTLYAITQLDDEQFARLIADHGNGFITESMVKTIRKGLLAKRDSWRVFATIYVDENAMKGQLFNEYAETLHELLSRAGTIPNVKIAESEAHEKIEHHFAKRIEAESKRILRTQLDSAINAYARSSVMPALNRKGKRKSLAARRNWVMKNLFACSKAELMTSFKEDPKSIFDQLDTDIYKEGQVWNEAAARVKTHRDKFAEKVRALASSTSADRDVPTPSIPVAPQSEVSAPLVMPVASGSEPMSIAAD